MREAKCYCTDEQGNRDCAAHGGSEPTEERATMSQHYSNPKRANDDYALPDVETFYVRADDPDFQQEDESLPEGWYYWYCHARLHA